MKLSFIPVGEVIPVYDREDAHDVPRVGEVIYLHDKTYRVLWVTGITVDFRW